MRAKHSGLRQATLTSRRMFRVSLRSAHLKRAESSSSWVFSRLCRGKPSRTVLDALISTMLTVIIGMTRDERQATEVVAEASRKLLSKQKNVSALWRALRYRIN
jgi:SH3-like domain-containing protein